MAKKTPSQVNNDLTKRRLDLLALARRQIKGRMIESGFTEEQLRGKSGMQIPDEDNVFAYCNINSELRIRAKKIIHRFNSEAELSKLMNDTF